MKTNIKIIMQSIGILFASTIIFSLVFAGLYYFHIISATFYHNLNWIFGALAYAVAGFFLGYNINKKALLHAFGIVAILGIVGYFLLPSTSIMLIIKLLSKLMVFLLGCILAVSKKP